MKPYKAKEPSQTINFIRNKLFDVGIFLKERHYDSDLFYASKVSICNQGLENLNIASNGKGMNSLYSLASAYAEFLERLQNNMLFDNHFYATGEFLEKDICSKDFKSRVLTNKTALDFRYDPREYSMNVEESANTYFNFYNKLFPFIKNKQDLISFIKKELLYDSLISIPFHSVKTKSEVFLPYEIILAACGSTGMCSGNTKNEALTQGFCEIFERYVGRRIYFENITPPDIPLDYFDNTDIIEKIKKLYENTNYTIKIKDCSLGQGLPVIGFLIIDTQNRKYNFHLGSSLSPIIALERCLTEIFQNPNGIHWLDINLTDFSNDNIEKKEYIFLNGNQIFAYGNGLWPKSIFSSQSSYDFNGLNNTLNRSDKQDLEFIKQKIYELGFDIYIRDVSFLDFPSYYIVVPGMSEYPILREQYHYLGNVLPTLIKLRNLKNLPEDELKIICNELNQNYYALTLIDFQFQNILLYHSNHDIKDLDIELLIFMLNYRLGNIEKAIHFISIFLKDKNFAAYKYYYGIKDYLILIKQQNSEEEILEILSHMYKDEADEIILDMKNPAKIFQYYEWPTCFDCDKCEIISDCKYFNSLKVIKQIQKKQAANLLNHNVQFI